MKLVEIGRRRHLKKKKKKDDFHIVLFFPFRFWVHQLSVCWHGMCSWETRLSGKQGMQTSSSLLLMSFG